MTVRQSNSRENVCLSYEPIPALRDRVNVRLLEKLRRDPRISITALGKHVGLSAPATAERIRRLEDAGILQGYAIAIAPESLGLPISAYIRVRPNAGHLARVADLARSIPEVVECHRITGDDCFIMRVFLPSMDQLDRVLDRFLQYGTTTTSIVQSSPVLLRSLPLPSMEKP